MQDRMFYSYKHLGGQLSNRMPHEEKKGREPTKHQQKWVFLVTYAPFYGGARAKGRQLIQRLVSIYKILRKSGPAEKNRGCTHRLPIPVAAFGPSNPEILTGIQGQVWGPDCFELLDAAPAYVSLKEFLNGRAQQSTFSMNEHGYPGCAGWTLRATRSNVCAKVIAARQVSLMLFACNYGHLPADA